MANNNQMVMVKIKDLKTADYNLNTTAARHTARKLRPK